MKPPGVNQASTPSRSQNSPIAPTDACEASAIASAAGSPKRSRIAASPNQSPLQKPPLRPLGPLPASSASITATRASGSSCFRCQAVHRPV